MQERMMPADTDAEEAVLGSLLIDHAALNDVAAVLRPEDFYREKNRWIYEACLAISDRFEPTDLLLVGRELQARDRFEAIGGTAYLSQLVAGVPTSTFALDYARLVQRSAFQRRLIRAAGQIAKLGYEGGEPAALLGKCYEELLPLADSGGSQGFRSLAEIARAEFPRRVEWGENPAEIGGISTRFADLDRLLGGLKPGVFYVLAARPSMGKSAMALALAVNVAQQGHTVGIFSIEMPAGDSWQRLVLAKAGLSDYAIRAGQAGLDWQARYWAAWREMEALGIHIDDAREITTGVMRARAAQLKARYPGLGLIIVDYAQIAADPDEKSEELRISRITDRLQGIARYLEIPLLGVYQLSREVERRPNRLPQLADLRYSGHVEEDADVVLMLYRKGYYAEREPENESFRVQGDERYRLDVLVEKHRNGPTGRIWLWYDPATGRIGNWGEADRYAR